VVGFGARREARIGPPARGLGPCTRPRRGSGTLGFPDFGASPAILLPGLWPEGSLVVAGSGAIWLSRSAFIALRVSGLASVPLYVTGHLLKDPASGLLRRASELASQRLSASPPPDGPANADEWRVRPSPDPYILRVDGRPARVPTLRASSWFGVFEVLADESNPLVLSVLPEASNPSLFDVFAPANVLKTLLGYRVTAVDHGTEGR